MVCNNCGAVLVCTESTDVKDSGAFEEQYECPSCGARGTISGEEDESPNQWRKAGVVFE